MNEKFLTPLSKNIQKFKIATFDIEAKNWTEFLYCGFYDGKKYFDFLDLEKFLLHVVNERYAGYKIFAHNGGKYDFLFFIDKIKHHTEIIDINGRIFSLKIKLNNKKQVAIYDSFYFLDVSLEKLIDTFEVKHKKIKVDFDKVNQTGLSDELKYHCKNDVIALYEIITKYQELINKLGGELRCTQGSQSLDLFRRQYLEPNKLKTYFYLDKIIRRGYYGGRNELYKKYGKNLNYYDFNSLYPAMMMKSMPIGTPIQVYDYKLSENDIGFCLIGININKKFNIPVLPYRHDMRLLFPTGKFSGWYPIPFLFKLQSLNIPFKIFQAILFEKDSNLFKNLILDLYKLRKENKNNALGYIVKKLMNSLYGKFAQKIERKKYIINPEFDKIENLKCYSSTFDIWYSEDDIESNFILPAISAYITAYGQLQLFEYLNDNTYYCDTDSIITSEKLETSGEIGGLKLEAEIDEFAGITQKAYCYKSGNKIVKRLKGVPEKYIENIKFNDFKNAILKNDYKIFDVSFKSLYGWRESIVRNKNKILYYDNHKKSILNIDTKRIFLDINKSIPLNI